VILGVDDPRGPDRATLYPLHEHAAARRTGLVAHLSRQQAHTVTIAAGDVVAFFA
jgi:hypothetical protein